MTSLRYRAFRVYQRAPEKLKRTVGRIVRLLPERVRYGSEHVRWHKFVTESQYWGIKRLQAYQLDQLRHSVTHAYEHVPFYRRLFDQHGIHPSDVKTLEDLRRFPIIDKTVTRAHRDDLIATNIAAADRLPVVSGGTTGSPFHYFWTPDVHAIERAFVRVVWEWSGYHYGEPLLRLRSVFQSDRLVTYDAAQNWLECRPFRLNDDFFRTVAQIARDFRPKVILGYPSLVHGLACGIQKLNLGDAFRSVKACIGASEKVYAFQREKVREVFGCFLSDWYAMGELVALFGWCPTCDCYHDVAQHSLTEILDPQGNEVSQPGVLGHVVGTAFLNRAFPFIRYRMDDLASLSPQSPRCGRSYRCIQEIHGRCGDFVVTPSGTLVGPTTLEFAIRYVRHVKDIQIYQKDRSQLIVRIVPDEGYQPQDGDRFCEEVLRRVGEPMRISVALLDTIERGASQKQRFVVSEIGSEYLVHDERPLKLQENRYAEDRVSDSRQGK